MSSVVICLLSDIPKPAPAAAPASAPSFNPGLDAAFSSTPIANSSAPAQGPGLNQDIFDEAFGALNTSPFEMPPVAMVHRHIHKDTYHAHINQVAVFFCNFCLFFTLQQTATIGQTSGSTNAFGEPFGNPFA